MPPSHNHPQLSPMPLLSRRDALRVGALSVAATTLPLGALANSATAQDAVLPGVEGVPPLPRQTRSFIFGWEGE